MGISVDPAEDFELIMYLQGNLDINTLPLKNQ